MLLLIFGTKPDTVLIATSNNVFIISPLDIDQVVPFQRSGVKAAQVAASLEMSAILNPAIFSPYYRLAQGTFRFPSEV